MSSFRFNTVTHLSRPIMAVSFLIGLILTLGVLNGDDSGRVNLLYLLIILLFVPLLGAALSVGSLFTAKGINFARLCSYIPLWTIAQQHYLHKIRQFSIDKPWFFLQSQAAALAYSTGSLLMFMILLLTTDVNFVWRSTLLNAEQLLPLLTLIAKPWFFWDAAQPSLALLQLTQDSRLTQVYSDVSEFKQWWAFILATQLTYAFFLRGILLVAAKIWLQQRANSDIEQRLRMKQYKQAKCQSHSPTLAVVTNKLPTDYALNNWAGLSTDKLSQLSIQPTHALPNTCIDDQPFNGLQLLLVKAWEPPMGELYDYMVQNQGLLFPINYATDKLTAPEIKHLAEWQRFAVNLPNWDIYLPSQWNKKHES